MTYAVSSVSSAGSSSRSRSASRSEPGPGCAAAERAGDVRRGPGPPHAAQATSREPCSPRGRASRAALPPGSTTERGGEPGLLDDPEQALDGYGVILEI